MNLSKLYEQSSFPCYLAKNSDRQTPNAVDRDYPRVPFALPWLLCLRTQPFRRSSYTSTVERLAGRSTRRRRHSTRQTAETLADFYRRRRAFSQASRVGPHSPRTLQDGNFYTGRNQRSNSDPTRVEINSSGPNCRLGGRPPARSR